MPRIAFRLRIKPGKEQEYDTAHRNVWPALLAKLKEVGMSDYASRQATSSTWRF
jgi:L-rhamnose mutarotase